MTDRNTILVTGATGKVGGQAASQLLAKGAEVRALTRTPETARLPKGADVVGGDLSDPGSLDAALDGIDAVLLVFPSVSADHAAPAIIEKIAKYARRVVYLSSTGVRDDRYEQGDPINQSHADVERLLQQTGVEWTFVRAGGFAGNTLGWAQQIRDHGVVRAPFGELARPLIHERDIAAVAVRALTEDGHVGLEHAVTGPKLLTQVEQLHAIGEAIGRTVRFEEIPRETAREEMVSDGWPPEYADGALDVWAGMMAAPESVTTTVEELTGAPAHTFYDWAVDHADDFR